MNTPETEKPIRTIRISSGAMWCESCERTTVAKYTTTRFYKAGKEVEVQMCEMCKNIQETEYFKGPTTKIKNRENK